MDRFGERLRDLRNEKEISQRKLSTLTGYSQPNISEWEANRVIPTANALLALAQVFDVSLDYLCGRADEPDTAMPYSPPTLTQDEKTALGYFNQLSKWQQSEVIGFMKGLIYNEKEREKKLT